MYHTTLPPVLVFVNKNSFVNSVSLSLSQAKSVFINNSSNLALVYCIFYTQMYTRNGLMTEVTLAA